MSNQAIDGRGTVQLKAQGNLGEAKEATLDGIAARIRGLACEREDTDSYSVFRLAPAVDAEYGFAAWIHDDGEPQLSAALTTVNDKRDFWYKPFELPDWPTPEERTRDFLATLSAVISNPTRITQSRGILTWSFECEFEDGGVWKSIGGISYLRFGNFAVPQIDGAHHRYTSPALE